MSYACRDADKARKLRHIVLMPKTEVAIPTILCMLALVTGGTWLLGELFGLGIEGTAIREHRDVLGLVFLASVCSLLVSAVAEHRRRSDRASRSDEKLEGARDDARSQRGRRH
jgi:hypothetical protein